MKKVLRSLWQDDAGIVALEYLLVATIVGLGLVVGLAALYEALTAELTELSNAILALDQSYEFTGLTTFSGGNGTGVVIGHRRGSGAFDSFQPNHVMRQVPTADNINVVVGTSPFVGP
jgi:Flp pilus assembly pilin Flp